MLTDELRVNIRHLYADVLWFGVLAGSTMAFLVIFAARQGASGFEISLLTASPAAVNLALNLGILSGSLAGPLLSEWLGLRPALFVVAGLRLLAGMLLAAWA